MEFLKSFDFELWWNKLIVVGLALVAGALAAKERDLVVIGLGLIACGFGELKNHKKLIEWTPPSAYVPQGMITSYPRVPTPLGVGLDVIGVGLMLFGLYRLLTA
ncbi:MAG: hypothetical protein C4523_00025 [Myxococcales bacterium]|nr:MAG: hypothetical protein C4523_00025 [Myxococcales bacterium]